MHSIKLPSNLFATRDTRPGLTCSFIHRCEGWNSLGLWRPGFWSTIETTIDSIKRLDYLDTEKNSHFTEHVFSVPW